MFDIDRFKAVNDTCGHVMGDRVLQGVAEALGSGVQDPTHCLARYGGEEFALVLPHCTQTAAIALAESCRERVKAMRVRDRRTQSVVLSVTISAGVTALQPGDDAQSFIARADEPCTQQGSWARSRDLGLNAYGEDVEALMSELDKVIGEAVSNQSVPFLVAMTGSAAGMTWSGAAGERSPGQAATVDTVFRIFSMTKAIGSTAAMILMDRGKLSPEATVRASCPSSAN